MPAHGGPQIKGMVDIGIDNAKEGGVAEKIGAVLDPPAGTEDFWLYPYLHLQAPSLTTNVSLYLIRQVMGVDDNPRCPHPL
jgi:hypothetical protein